ncbi:multiple epidermal growth factor-like domains 10, partial [Plakobranchus ocellatus]
HIAKIQIQSSARSAYSCRTAKLDSKTVDFVCSGFGVRNRIILSNIAHIEVCEIYVSKGRNVALHQATTQSSTYLDWGPENAVNGNLGTVDGSDYELSTECTHTNEGSSSRGFWRVTFSHPMNIIGADIYNRRNPSRGCCERRLMGFTLTVYDSSDRSLYSYTDQRYSPLDVYHILFDPIRTKKATAVEIKKSRYSFFLTLCEVLIYGDSDCPSSKFGRQCERDCNCADDQDACFVATGGCPSGCAPGYTGEDCWTPCARGYYGSGCSETCSSHCGGYHSRCDPKDGTCFHGCDIGYQPPLCKEECITGTYGYQCAQACSIHCAGPNKTCSSTDGSCDQGCKAGYLPPQCNEVCPDGKYGLQCAQQCSIFCAGTNNKCSPFDGSCDQGCIVGYQPPICYQVCDAGSYGQNCTQSCSIYCAGTNSPCRPFDGSCTQGCEVGYQPPLCDQECHIGTYGPGCAQTCSGYCAGQNNTCNPLNGTCDHGCDVGFQPPLCDNGRKIMIMAISKFVMLAVMDKIAHRAVVSTVLELTALAVLLMGHVPRAVRWATSLLSVIKTVILEPMASTVHRCVVNIVLVKTIPVALLMGHVTTAVKLAFSLHSVTEFVIMAVMAKIAHKTVVSTVLELTALAVLLMDHVTRTVRWATSLHFVIKSVTMEPMALAVPKNVVDTVLIKTTPVALLMGHVTMAVMLDFSLHSVIKHYHKMSQKGLTFAAPPCLHLEGNLAENWRKWQQRFQLYLEASELDKKPKKQQKAILLHTIGPDALELFNAFTFSEEEDIDDIRVIMQKFEEYCKPKRNLIYDRHQFLTKQQQEGESFDQFVTELKRLSAD